MNDVYKTEKIKNRMKEIRESGFNEQLYPIRPQKKKIETTILKGNYQIQNLQKKKSEIIHENKIKYKLGRD